VQKAVRDALIAFMGRHGASTSRGNESRPAGIEHAKAKGESYRGRKPSYTREQFATVRNMLGQEANIVAISKATNLSRQTVYRIKDDPAAAEAALATWARRAFAQLARARDRLPSQA
jgi:DNA invertase Pin-like site-specific DNA recombinase